MRQGLFGHVKLLVLGPVEMPLRFAHCLFAGCIAMRLARSLRGHAVTDDGLDCDQARTIVRLCGANRRVDLVEIIAVGDCYRVPAVSVETLSNSFAERETRETFERDVVVVAEIDQFAEFEMTGKRCCFRGD